MSLSPEDIRRRIAAIDGWTFDGANIVRTHRCASFRQALELVNRVGDAAEAANHHPDIDIRYDTVRFAVHTHSAGGVTEKDFELARAINALIGQLA